MRRHVCSEGFVCVGGPDRRPRLGVVHGDGEWRSIEAGVGTRSRAPFAARTAGARVGSRRDRHPRGRRKRSERWWLPRRSPRAARSDRRPLPRAVFVVRRAVRVGSASSGGHRDRRLTSPRVVEERAAAVDAADLPVAAVGTPIAQSYEQCRDVLAVPIGTAPCRTRATRREGRFRCHFEANFVGFTCAAVHLGGRNAAVDGDVVDHLLSRVDPTAKICVCAHDPRQSAIREPGHRLDHRALWFSVIGTQVPLTSFGGPSKAFFESAHRLSRHWREHTRHLARCASADPVTRRWRSASKRAHASRRGAVPRSKPKRPTGQVVYTTFWRSHECFRRAPADRPEKPGLAQPVDARMPMVPCETGGQGSGAGGGDGGVVL